MLRVTGLFPGINGQQDKYYDNEYVKLEDFAKQANHPVPKSYQHFALANSQKHINRITKHQHRSEGIRVMARQELTIRGNRVVIEYVEGMKTKREGNVTTEVAFPRKITVSTRSLLGAVSTKTEWDREKAFYLSIIPACETSPFHNPARHQGMYILHDPRVQAKAQMKQVMGRVEAVQKVYNDELPEIRMRILASGMGIITKGMDISEIKTSLMMKADTNSALFVQQFYDHSIMALGLVNLCRERNIIKFIGKSGQYYLAIDETLARVTGNSGIDILNEGYSSQRLGLSALVDTVSQNDKSFKMLAKMLNKSVKDGSTGQAKSASQIARSEAKMDALFSDLDDNMAALADAGTDTITVDNPPAGTNKASTKAAASAPPVINE